jgi:hypothetical protein
MPQKYKNVLAEITALSALMLLGGYFLNKWVLKRRLREQARKLAMSIAACDRDDDNGLFDDEGFYEYDDDDFDGDNPDDDYIKTLMQDLKGENDE